MHKIYKIYKSIKMRLFRKNIIILECIIMDYKSLHLAFLKSNSQFTPKYSYDYTEPYFNIISELYRNPRVTNNHAQMFFETDMQWQKTCQSSVKSLTRELHKNNPNAPVFVTIGFNHQTWNIPSCVKVIETIVARPWIKTIRAVFEIHRDNGLHPHVHMLIEPLEPLTKSKMLEKIWAIAGIKEVCLKKSFIDYKVAADYHHKYILLEKKEDKMQYVAKDIEWRKKNHIKEFWEKSI